MKSDLSKTVTLVFIAVFLFLSTFWITIRISKVERQIANLQGQMVSDSLRREEEAKQLKKDLRLDDMDRLGGCFSLHHTTNRSDLKPFLGRPLKIGACRLEAEAEPTSVIYAVDAGPDEETKDSRGELDGGLTIDAIRTIFGPR